MSKFKCCGKGCKDHKRNIERARQENARNHQRECICDICELNRIAKQQEYEKGYFKVICYSYVVMVGLLFVGVALHVGI